MKELFEDEINKMAKELKEGQTHYQNDGCGEPEHNDKTCTCKSKHCIHYESDFDRFVKDNPIKELALCKTCNQMTNHSGEVCLKCNPQSIESWVEETFDVDIIPNTACISGFMISCDKGYLTKSVQDLLSNQKEDIKKVIKDKYGEMDGIMDLIDNLK